MPDTFATLPDDLAARLSALARTFPSLARTAGVEPFDPVKLAAVYDSIVAMGWAGSDLLASFAIQIVLTDFYNETAGPEFRPYIRSLGKTALQSIDGAVRDFNLYDARTSLDAAHRAALAQWIMGDAGKVEIIDPNPPSPH